MELLGATLLTKDGERPTQEVLGGKVVGLYFSAHWCPPCRGFTPKLAEAYSQHLQAKGMEVVFVSSDRDEAAFAEYFADMPWVALPYAAREAKAALSKKFKVQGIPSLVLLDQDGATITLDGRDKVGSDPEGAGFPWKPRPLSELLDTPLEGKAGKTSMASLDGKVLGLYFSAHWCPPCRGFTPQLAAKYAEIQAAGLPFEIVFVSSDRDEAACSEYFADMPWFALPYADRARKEALSSYFKVEGIPTLVLLDKDRSVIATNGRGAVMGGDLADFPFYPKPVQSLSDPDGIDETPSVIVFAESSSAVDQEKAYAALEPVAREVLAASKASGEDPEFLFFLARSSAGPAGQVRQLAKLPAVIAPHEHPLERKEGGGWGCDGCGRPGHQCKERHRCTQGCDHDFCEVCVVKAAEEQTALPQALVLLDIPDEGGYYTPEHPITTEGIRQLLGDYRAKKLSRKQIEQ